MDVVTAVIDRRRRLDENDHTEHRNPGKGPGRYAHRAETAQEGQGRETGAPRYAVQGQVDQEDDPGEEGRQGAQKASYGEGRGRPPGQQDRQDPGPAKASRWRRVEGTDDLRFTLHLARMMTGILAYLAFP